MTRGYDSVQDPIQRLVPLATDYYGRNCSLRCGETSEKSSNRTFELCAVAM